MTTNTNAALREKLIDMIAEHLSGTYRCLRVWEAWNFGTMSQDDFDDVGESDTPPELADAILAALSTAAQPLTQDEQENQLCMSSASCGQASTNESAFITSTQRSAGTFSASSERQSYRDSDGMPTERAVLEREWRRMKIALSATCAAIAHRADAAAAAHVQRLAA